jgi:transposase
MAKVTAEVKLQAVKKYLEGMEGQKAVADSVGVSKAILQTWIRQYQHHGEGSFKKSYTTYSADYKLMVLGYINEYGTSIREAAAIFNIPTHSAVSRWMNQLETKGVDGLKPKQRGRPLMKEEKKPVPPVEGSAEALQAEVERLRMENAYLKKLNALVQSKEQLRSKTKRK